MIDANVPPAPGPGPDPAAIDDLRQRFRSLQADEKAARGEARRLARELALARRLLRFHLGATAMPPALAVTPDAGAATVLLSEPLVYHFDEHRDCGAHTAFSGWAFRPVPGWDALATRTTLLLRHDDTVYATRCRKVLRPDVAALYARQEPGASGGAVGLDGVGFACEVRHDALPAGAGWKVVLRLECGGQACEQFTGQTLRV